MVEGGQDPGISAEERVRPATERLVDGTYVELLHRSGHGTPTVVTFGDEQTAPRGQAARGFGLRDPETDLYEIRPRGPHWYPATETGPLADTLARDKHGRPAVALGASMGGYGALRYGARAGCDTAVAFSPQARIAPGMAGVGSRYGTHYRADLHDEMEIARSHLPERAYAIFDPEDAHDLLHAELLRHEAGVEVIPLTHMGHRTERALSSPEIFDAVVRAAAAGDREDLARALRRGRRGVTDFLARLSIAATDGGHPGWGVDIARLPEQQGGLLAPDLRLALAVARSGLGRPFEALEEIEGLIVEAPRHVRYWRVLVDQYEAMGAQEAAAEVLELALGETENFLFCWKLIRNRMEAGANEQARLLAELALEHWPERAAQVERVKARIGAAA